MEKTLLRLRSPVQYPALTTGAIISFPSYHVVLVVLAAAAYGGPRGASMGRDLHAVGLHLDNDDGMALYDGCTGRHSGRGSVLVCGAARVERFSTKHPPNFPARICVGSRWKDTRRAEVSCVVHPAGDLLAAGAAGLVIYPIVWLLLLPFRIVGIAVARCWRWYGCWLCCRRGFCARWPDQMDLEEPNGNDQDGV